MRNNAMVTELAADLEVVPYLNLHNLLSDPDEPKESTLTIKELIPKGWSLACKYAVASLKHEACGALIKSESGSYAILDYLDSVKLNRDAAALFLDKLSPALRCN